jgi:hypothetical protein
MFKVIESDHNPINIGDNVLATLSVNKKVRTNVDKKKSRMTVTDLAKIMNAHFDKIEAVQKEQGDLLQTIIKLNNLKTA